jgi:hypothetical protein
MRMTRLSIAAALTAFALAAAQPARAQHTFPQTLYWGSGLVDIPTAWVSPLPGDFAINYSAKRFSADPTAAKINYSNRVNSQLTFSISGWGLLELGYAAYSSNPEWGFFGKGLLINQENLRPKGGLIAWMPSVAVGMRNVGPYEHIDRFGIGYQLLPPTAGEPDAQHVVDTLHQNFSTANTVYGVATESFALSDIRAGWADVGVSLSVGYGNGLFSDDGGLGEAYSGHSTGGLFYGGKVDFNATPNLGISLMAENNAWDYNLGGALDYRGIRAGVYVTDLGGSGEASTDTTSNPTNAQRASRIYNYSKVAFTLGWQSNIFALLKGDFLQNRAAELERQRTALLEEIQRRQQRIAALELEINRYEAQNLLELEQRRAQAEAELRAEREALQRLEDRLRRIEGQNNPPPTPPQR